MNNDKDKLITDLRWVLKKISELNGRENILGEAVSYARYGLALGDGSE